MEATRGKQRLGFVSAAVALGVAAAFAALLAFQSYGAVRFVPYCAIYVLLPGLFLLRVVFRWRGEALQTLLLAVFVGLAFLFLQYYVFNLAGVLWLLRFISLLPALCEAAYWLRWVWKRRRQTRSLFSKLYQNLATHHLLCWLLGLGVALSYWYTSRLYATPNTVWNPDYQWHMGNMYTLAEPGFADIRVLGMDFRYHYFSDLFFAIGRVVLGLNPYECAMRFPALLVPLLMVPCFELLLRDVVPVRWQRFLLCGAGLYLFSLNGAYNDYSYQWLSNINSVGLALPCALLFLLETRQLQQAVRAGEKAPVSTVALMTMLMLLLTGFKGPFAVCALAAGAGYTLLCWIKRQRLGRVWYVACFAVAAAFLLVWALLLRNGLNDDYVQSWRPFTSVGHAVVLAPLIRALGDSVWAHLLLLPLHFILIAGIFSLPFIAACVRLVARLFRRGAVWESDFSALCTAGAVLSLAAFYLFDLTGRSQNYFMYFAVPLIVRAAVPEMLLWGKAAARLAGAKRLVARAGTALVLAAALVCSGLLVYRENGYIYYSEEEMGAVAWIEENVPRDSLLAVNRHGAFYMLSGYTGRRFYIEGTAYAKNSGYTSNRLEEQTLQNDSLFMQQTPNAQRLALAKELGIQYLVQWKSEMAPDELKAPFGDGFQLCFTSNDVDIWQVL